MPGKVHKFKLSESREPVTVAIPQPGGGYLVSERELVLEQWAEMEEGKPTKYMTEIYIQK